MKRTAVCTVKTIGWDSPMRTVFRVDCNTCKRMLGNFTQHESAMAWAQVHAASSKHIIGREGA